MNLRLQIEKWNFHQTYPLHPTRSDVDNLYRGRVNGPTTCRGIFTIFNSASL